MVNWDGILYCATANHVYVWAENEWIEMNS